MCQRVRVCKGFRPGFSRVGGGWSQKKMPIHTCFYDLVPKLRLGGLENRLHQFSAHFSLPTILGPSTDSPSGQLLSVPVHMGQGESQRGQVTHSTVTAPKSEEEDCQGRSSSVSSLCPWGTQSQESCILKALWSAKCWN